MTSKTKLPEAELWVATGLRGLETHQPNHVVGVSRDEVNEEVESAHGPGWTVWTTEPYYTAEQLQAYGDAREAYARAAVEQANPEGDAYESLMVSSAETYFRELKAPPAAAVEGDAHFTTDNASTRYLCDGPNGYFYTGDIETARRLVNIIDPQAEDWTITDLANPYGKPADSAGVMEAAQAYIELLESCTDGYYCVEESEQFKTYRAALSAASPSAGVTEAMVEPLTASMCHHPEYARGWNDALAAAGGGK